MRTKGQTRFLTWLSRTIDRARNLYTRAIAYWSGGIWADNRKNWRVNTLKTLNLTISSFLNADLQSQACAMTYRTTLAVVPALALVFAIGRGFGFQNLLQDEIMNLFPSQHVALEHALSFVYSYLDQSSEGLFVGIGLVFLLWTLISLISSVENSFNLVFGVKQGRSFWRKITDYTALLLILPVLMICGGGLSIFLSSTLQDFFDIKFMTPVLTILLEVLSWMFTWLFFAGMFVMIPNAKVRLPNALLAGVITGTGFRVLQWLFVTGQLYVTKYNAVYGSFSFLPLMLIWMQLTWVIILTGALLCYTSQTLSFYSFSTQVNAISPKYRRRVTLVVAAVVAQRFAQRKPPYVASELASVTNVPPRLLGDVLDDLIKARILVRAVVDLKHEVYGFQPAVDTDVLTVGYVTQALENLGNSNFIPGFKKQFGIITDAGPDTLLTTLRFNDADK